MPGRFRALLPQKRSSNALSRGSRSSEEGSITVGPGGTSSKCASPAPDSVRREDLVHARSYSAPPLRISSLDAMSSESAAPPSKLAIEHKVLVLGASQSGKSTLLKQLRLLYASPGEINYLRETYRIAIYLDLIDLINKCLTIDLHQHRRDINAPALRKLRLTPVLALAAKLENSLSTRHSSSDTLTGPPLSPSKRKTGETVALYIFSALSAEISKLFEETFSVLIPTPYQRYLISRQQAICTSMYLPTDEDVLQVQLDTIGVEECRIRPTAEFDFQFCDVSGSRGKRHVWSRFFEDAACIIFVIDTSSFDKRTGKNSNELEDSLRLLAKVCRNPLLKKVEIAVYLNKVDLLKKKTRGGADLGTYFCDYQRQSGSYQAALAYLRERVQRIALEIRPNTALASHLSRRDISVQVMQATDAKQVVLAMENLKDALRLEAVV